MLQRMTTFRNDLNQTSLTHDKSNSPRKADEVIHLPPKIPRLDLTPSSLYSKFYDKSRPMEPFVLPDSDAVPDISFVVAPGTDSIQRFRRPFFAMENSPTDLSVSDYKHLLDLAKTGFVSFDSHTLAEKTTKLDHDSQSGSAPASMSTANSASSTASPVANEWCSRVTNTAYLSSAWLSDLTTSVEASSGQRKKERAYLEKKISFWETQRKMSEEAKIKELELRLSCLLRTPPVLEDPYLKPQPIPQELPYKRPVKPSLPVLTESQSAEVMRRLAEGNEETVIVNSYRLAMTRRELITLTGTNWLNDMVINFYLQMLAHRSRQGFQTAAEGPPRVATMNSFFYPKLVSGAGYAGVRRWTRSINLFDYDLILVPIHDRTIHWCLVGIDLRKKTLSYYDSMGGTNERCLNALLNYLDSESRDKMQKPLDLMSTWRKINTGTSVPQQKNGSDCGVFLCTYAEFLSRDAEFTFSQEDMPDIRQRMVYEILTRQLLTTGTQLTDV